MAHYFTNDLEEVTRIIYLDSVDPDTLIGSKFIKKVPDPDNIPNKLPVLIDGPDGLFYEYRDLPIITPVDPPLEPLTPSEFEVLKQENTDLRSRLIQAERVSNENALANQELLELLIELGVI